MGCVGAKALRQRNPDKDCNAVASATEANLILQPKDVTNAADDLPGLDLALCLTCADPAANKANNAPELELALRLASDECPGSAAAANLKNHFEGDVVENVQPHDRLDYANPMLDLHASGSSLHPDVQEPEAGAPSQMCVASSPQMALPNSQTSGGFKGSSSVFKTSTGRSSTPIQRRSATPNKSTSPECRLQPGGTVLLTSSVPLEASRKSAAASPERRASSRQQGREHSQTPKKRKTTRRGALADDWSGSLDPQLGRPLHLSLDIQQRFDTLQGLDAFVVQSSEYQDAVANVIDMMVERKLTLNHVNCHQSFTELSECGSLRPPAFQCMLGHRVSELDHNDICRGLGYYHFDRVSAGTMTNSPNFVLNQEGSVMFFIDPHVLTKHHFIACKGNTAKESGERCPGKLHSKMTKTVALKEALRAVSKLQGMIMQGVGKVPFNNEIAVFQGIESCFVYPYLAVLEGSRLPEALAQRAFTVKPTTSRYEAGLEAMRRSLAMRR